MDLSQPFLVYKSSAGSGKTFNLAKVYLSLILGTTDPTYFRQILAITFTVKAAAEMKDRIITYLSILAGNSSRHRNDSEAMMAVLMDELGLSREVISERSKQRLDHILHQYGDLHIVTIDKFFARLIRAFASELTLSPDFEITIDHSQFVDRATELLYERIGEDQDLTHLILHLLHSRLSEDSSNNADDVIQNACNTLLSDDFYFIRDRFKNWEPKEVYELKDQLQVESESIKEQFIAPAKAAMELLRSRGIEAADVARGNSGIYAYFRRLADGDLSKVAPNSYVIATIEEDKWMSGKKNEAVEYVKDELRTRYEEIQAFLPLYEQYSLIQAILKSIYTLGFFSALEEVIQDIQEEDNVRLLSEFNTMISDQLQHEQTSFLFERLGNQFQHILIDEFQDTSVLQWKNLIPLVENSLSEGNTSLIVGDAKQSIYRWRNSDPEQFVSLPTVEHPAKELFEASYKEIVLAQNFRSAKNVVDFNNRFFEAMKIQLLDKAHQNTYDELKQTPVSKNPGKVRWWIEADKDKKKDDLMLKYVDRVRTLVDKEKVRPGEICCLFRTNKDAAEVASMLLQSGLDVVSQESLLLASNPLVQLLVTSLHALQREKDPFIVQLWLSRMHHVKPLEHYHNLARKAKHEKWSFGQASQSIGYNLLTPEIKQGDTFQRSMALCRELKLDVTNPFVSKFLDICLHYEQTGGYLKESFLERWEKLSIDTSIQLSETPDAVSVMTIHKSKGLEYPVVLVFLPEIKKKNTKDNGWVELKAPFDMGMVQLSLSSLKETPFKALYESEDARSMLDMLNVLYVAFTRAERHLEILSNAPSKESPLHEITTWNEWNEEKRVLEIG